jgi:hypothetical protein
MNRLYGMVLKRTCLNLSVQMTDRAREDCKDGTVERVEHSYVQDVGKVTFGSQLFCSVYLTRWLFRPPATVTTDPNCL